MWLALVVVCTTPDVVSCNVLAKSDNVFLTEESCREEVTYAVDLLSPSVYYVFGGCSKLGEAA